MLLTCNISIILGVMEALVFVTSLTTHNLMLPCSFDTQPLSTTNLNQVVSADPPTNESLGET